MSCKYVIVVGGVYSGTGKGIASSSIGLLLKMRGEKINLIKCDPYLNLNAGTMSPKQHGEVFLCDDGSETDLDLGSYERMTGIIMSRKNIFTNGMVYKSVFTKEENGEYLGETVQILPHVTDQIIQRIKEAGEGFDVLMVEIGGTVGDYESAGMYEAIQQLKQSEPDNVMIIMVAPIILNRTVNELKTKPLQNSVRNLQSFGLKPEMLLCRCETEIPNDVLDKIARFTNIPRTSVIEAPDVSSIYQVPIEFYERDVDDLIVDRFRLKRSGIQIKKYRNLVEKCVNGQNLPIVKIAVVGKYENCTEAYLSLKESLIHAGVANNIRVDIIWINAEKFDRSELDLKEIFEGVHGIIVPGGFDKRGVDGKITAIKFCRENKIPFLGICLGLQCAVIEFSRNVLGLSNATSQEFDPKCADPVVHFIEGQSLNIKKSGTMRLGSYECELEKDSIVRELYKKKTISERHRHRYEVNNAYVSKFESNGFIVSGRNPDTGLVEMMELKQDIHPFFVGTQAHPEFKSRLSEPAPLFDGLIAAAAKIINKATQ